MTAFLIFLSFLFVVDDFGSLVPTIFKPLLLKNGNVKVIFHSAILCVILTSIVSCESAEEKLANPDGVTRINLSYEKYTELPAELMNFKDLEALTLTGNNITALDKEIMLSMTNLKELKLSKNPITEIPDWLFELPLERLILDETKVDTINLALTKDLVKLSYRDTPFELKEEKRREALSEEGGSSESFHEFAVRKFLGKEYGYTMEFKKGVLYYTKSVSKTKVMELGQYLEDQGYFNDDKPIAMQITYNDKSDVAAYELRAIYAVEEEPAEGIQMLFTIQAIFISSQVFDDKPVHFHLTDNEFNSLYIYKSKE